MRSSSMVMTTIAGRLGIKELANPPADRGQVGNPVKGSTPGAGAARGSASARRDRSRCSCSSACSNSVRARSTADSSCA